MSNTNRITKYITIIESYLPEYEASNPKISTSTVGWQLDHSLKVINGVIMLLKNAPTGKQPKVTLFGLFCLWTRYIPRGKGKAPKTVMPPETINLSELHHQIETAKQLLADLKNIPQKATFKHPYFGVLTKTQTIKFIEVHTKHHLKIIKDILR